MIDVERPSLSTWRKERVRLRRKVFANEPNWAAYPDFIEKKILDQKKNPFWREHRLIPFLAKRAGEPLCTAALIMPGDGDGGGCWFGFFDAAFDLEAVSAVMRSLEGTAHALGVKRILGPANPTLYYEPGVQVEGFRCSSAPGLALSPPYYAELFDTIGYAAAKDLIGLIIPTHSDCPPVLRYAMRIAERKGITLSPFDLKNRRGMIDTMARFHAVTFERNWGEPELSRDDVAFLWSMFHDLVDKSLFLQARDNEGELVGLALAIPNHTAMFRKLKRSRTPVGNILALTSYGQVDSVRLAIFGIHPEHRFDAAAGALLGSGPIDVSVAI